MNEFLELVKWAAGPAAAAAASYFALRERMSVLETKVNNMKDTLDEVREDVKQLQVGG